ncbi:plastid lipid associated protein CHRC [Solanum lycopersicum]|uniref:Plastid lipid associated protein CHRC n=1 Tax=Solanum lycopersicum TaxID=4081 RepID=Q0ZPA3_SOLLC|nr:plastid lipid associated protein CHRC [Solanum lycopersicum]ABC42191.1 plastid lipid associated protein CHRC [Solanum lycopersicum]
MASISSLNQIPCRTLQITSQYSKPTSKISTLPISSTNFPSKTELHRAISVKEFTYPKPKFTAQATNYDKEDEWGPEVEKISPGGVAVVDEEPPKEPSEIELLKKQLADSFYGTNRGLSASSETRAEIVELITQLESKNPNPAPTEALTLLNGKWILAYTSFSGLFPLLSRGNLLLVRVEEISQTIDSESFTVQNSVVFAGPLATTSISTNAKFEVRSPKRVQIKFEEGIIGTPQLTDSIVLPENVEFLGQKIDLSPFKGLITSVQDTASSVAKSISSQPPIKFPISNNNAQSWLLTTYLDDELRISRGDAGSVFVLIKEGSPLLKP